MGLRVMTKEEFADVMTKVKAEFIASITDEDFKDLVTFLIDDMQTPRTINSEAVGSLILMRLVEAFNALELLVYKTAVH